MKWAATFTIMSVIFIIQLIRDLNCKVSTELDIANQLVTVATDLSSISEAHKVTVAKTIAAERESARSMPHLRCRRQAPPAFRRTHMSPKSSHTSKRPGKGELTIHACGAALHKRVIEVCASFERAIGLGDARRRRREIGERSGSSCSAHLATYGTL